MLNKRININPTKSLVLAFALTPFLAVATNNIEKTIVPETHPAVPKVAESSTKTNDPAIYSINMVAPMEQLLDDPVVGWSALAGRTLLRGQATDAVLKNPITLKTRESLTKNEARMAIETVLGMNGVTVVPMGEKFAKIVVEANAGNAGGEIHGHGDIPEMGRFVTQIIQWKHAAPNDISEILKPFSRGGGANIMVIPNSQTLVLRDYAENVHRMIEMVERIDVPSTFEVKPEIIPIKYALSSDIQSVLSSLGAGGGGSVGGHASSGSDFRHTGSMPNNMVGMNGVNSNNNNNNAPANTIGGGGTRSAFQNNLQKLVSNAAANSGSGDFQVLGQAKIINDDRTNSLLVFANKEDMEMIKTVISQLDVVLAQVLIEAIIMEVSLGKNKDLGISYLQGQKDLGSGISTIGGINNPASGGASGIDVKSLLAGAAGYASGFSYLAQFGGGDLNIIATAIAGDNRANVLSRPRIQTSHAEQASLFVGQTVPYVTGTYYGGYDGGSSQYQEKSVGINLDVLPLINSDGLVVMDIRQDIDQITSYVMIDGNQVPVTTKRTANSKVAVRDRDTIMLGGFISNTKSTTRSGVPGLMNVPVIGALFRSNSDKSEKVELIVLIRPTVLPTPQSAAIFATEERYKMPGVRQAQREIREENRKDIEAYELQRQKAEAAKEKKANKKGNTNTKTPTMPEIKSVEPVTFESTTIN